MTLDHSRPQTARYPRPEDAATRFRHEALFYSGVGDFVVTASAFIREGVADDEPVLVVVGGEKIGLLREELGGDAAKVDFKDMDDVGMNPARIIPAWYDFVAERATDGKHIRGIGEPISNERTPEGLVECQRHESLLNLAFADASAWWLLCPYDRSALDGPILDEALRSHPHILEGGAHRTSESYLDLDAIAAPFDRPLPEPRVPTWDLAFSIEDLSKLRKAVLDHASNNGIPRDRAEDLVVAVNEVAINSLRHGGGKGTLRVWREGGMLTCEVRDGGHLNLPLVGRRRPEANQEGGFGIWVVHQLCDLVQMRTFADGTVVRVHMSVGA